MKLFLALLLLSVSFLSFGKIEGITQISYLLASNKGFGQSSFGHAYIRLSKGEKLRKSDIVVEFVADVESKDINIFRGMGIGENYKVKIVDTTYAKVHQFHTIRENRDLTTYRLNLEKKEIDTIVNEINQIIENGLDEEYAFFSTNCASVTTSILNRALESKIDNFTSRIPISLPDLLSKRGLVLDEVTDGRVEIQRVELVERYKKEISKEEIHERLFSKLQSTSLTVRLEGYYDLHILKYKLEKKPSFKVNILANKLLKLESLGVRHNLVAYFNSGEQKLDRIELPEFRFGKDLNLKQPSVKSAYFSNHKEKVYFVVELKYKYGRKDGDGPLDKETRHSVLVPNLRYVDGKILDYRNRVVTYRFDSEFIGTKFYNPNLYTSARIEKETGINLYVKPLIYVERKKVEKGKLSQNDDLAIRNGEGGVGFCLSHSELSFLIKRQAIFLPNKAPFGEEKLLDALEDLYLGKVVIIPGYNNAKELTESVDIEKLFKVLTRRHRSEFSWIKMAKDYFSEVGVDSRNFYNISNLISVGVNPIVYFKVEGKNVGHSIIISEVIDKGEYFELNGLDPNFGYVKGHFKFMKRTSELKTAFYGITEMRIRPINLTLETLYRSKVNSSVIRGRAETMLDRMPRASFYLSDLY